jgi:uncharacterized membrane protein
VNRGGFDVTEETPLGAVVAVFQTPDGASQALEDVRHLGADMLAIKEAAVLVRDAENNLEIKESHHVAKGAVVGGLTGAVIGLIAGPVGWVAVGGAAVGALANRLRDTGFPDERLRQIGEALTPSTSALVAIVEHRWILGVEQRLRGQGADVTTEGVRAEVAQQLEESGSRTT